MPQEKPVLAVQLLQPSFVRLLGPRYEALLADLQAQAKKYISIDMDIRINFNAPIDIRIGIRSDIDITKEYAALSLMQVIAGPSLAVLPLPSSKLNSDRKVLSLFWIGWLLSLPCDAKLNSFLAEPKFLSQSLDPEVRIRFLSTPAKSQWLTWLCLLAQQETSGKTINKTRLSEHIWLFIKEQWDELHWFLQTNINPTLRECLFALYHSKNPEKNIISPYQIVLAEMLKQGYPTLSASVSIKLYYDEEMHQLDWSSIPAKEYGAFLEIFPLLSLPKLNNYLRIYQQKLRPYLWPLLIEAIQKNLPDVAQCLLDLGASMHHEYGETALLYSARIGNICALDFLLKNHLSKVSLKDRDDFGYTALLLAAANSQIKMLDYLLTHCPNEVSLEERSDAGSTVLLAAILEGEIDMVDHLLKQYPENLTLEEGDNTAYTSLLVAIANGQIGVTDRLLQRRHLDLSATSSTGYSTLCVAMENQQIEMLEHLLTKYTNFLGLEIWGNMRNKPYEINLKGKRSLSEAAMAELKRQLKNSKTIFIIETDSATLTNETFSSAATVSHFVPASPSFSSFFPSPIKSPNETFSFYSQSSSLRSPSPPNRLISKSTGACSSSTATISNFVPASPSFSGLISSPVKPLNELISTKKNRNTYSHQAYQNTVLNSKLGGLKRNASSFEESSVGDPLPSRQTGLRVDANSIKSKQRTKKNTTLSLFKHRSMGVFNLSQNSSSPRECPPSHPEAYSLGTGL